MKPIYLSLLIGILSSGCQKLTEDPQSQMTPDNYFRTQKDLDASVSAIYACYNGDYMAGSITFFINAFGADDLAGREFSSKEDPRLYDGLNAQPYSWRTDALWRLTWASVNQANHVIENYKRIQSTDDLKNGSAAQAYFLRAYGYYRLAHAFGELPLVIQPTDVDDRLPRSSVKDVYDLIVSDLKTAISLFPEKFPTKSNRANPLAAKALLADVYLSMTGWPLNMTDHYALAATEAKDVIQSDAYSLMPDYATFFTTDDNEESIFAIKFDQAGGVPSRMYGQFAIPQWEESLNRESGWEDYAPEINFYKNAPRCKRSWQTFYDTLKITETVNGKKVWKKVPSLEYWKLYKLVFFKKFRYGLGVPGNGDGCVETDSTIISMSPNSGKDNVLLRYAGVLLTYAEASAMAAGYPSQASYDAVNLVRRRAGLGDITPNLAVVDFRDSVVHERAYEFAGENGVRWYDVQRLQLLPKIIAERSPDESVKLWELNDISTRYLAPIPQFEMNLNPSWSQNPGY